MDGLYVLKDFGSQNGTFVNGERVTGRRALNDADTIGLGKFTLVFNGDTQATKEDGAEAQIRDKAAYAVAGETLVGKVSAQALERPVPSPGSSSASAPPRTSPRSTCSTTTSRSWAPRPTRTCASTAAPITPRRSCAPGRASS